MYTYRHSTVRTYGCSTDTGVRIYRYGHSTFFATGVLTYMHGRMYGHSTFPFLSDIPYKAYIQKSLTMECC